MKVSQAAIKRSASQAPSPFEKTAPGRSSSKLNKKKGFNLVCVAFHARLAVEICLCEKGAGNDGFSVPFCKVIDGVASCPELPEAGFRAHCNRRQNLDVNKKLTGIDGWDRFVLVRCVNEMEPSTQATRQEGLTFLKRFFMDGNHQSCPPSDINTVDMTDHLAERAMNDCFLDEDIHTLITENVHEDVLDHHFASSFWDLAIKFFRGTDIPTFACDTHGHSDSPAPVVPLVPNMNESGPKDDQKPGSINSDEKHEEKNPLSVDLKSEQKPATVDAKTASAETENPIEDNSASVHNKNHEDDETEESPDNEQKSKEDNKGNVSKCPNSSKGKDEEDANDTEEELEQEKEFEIEKEGEKKDNVVEKTIASKRRQKRARRSQSIVQCN